MSPFPPVYIHLPVVQQNNFDGQHNSWHEEPFEWFGEGVLVVPLVHVSMRGIGILPPITGHSLLSGTAAQPANIHRQVAVMLCAYTGEPQPTYRSATAIVDLAARGSAQ